MRLKSLIFYFVFLFTFTTHCVSSEELLKSSDVDRMMKQIFQAHVDKKEMSSEILKNAFKMYLDHFDPDRMYLLQSEVAPYLNLSSSQIDQLMEQYKRNDFSAFTKLNDLIISAILRSRDYRKEIIKNSQAEIFTPTASSGIDHESDLKKSFAKDPAELKKRNLILLQQFVFEEKRQFGEKQVLKNRDQILTLFQEHLANYEDQYLGVDRLGKSLSAAQKENLFILHVLKALAGSLDAHTAFMDRNEAYDMKMRLEKEFDGIGVVLERSPGGVIIKNLVPQGPAAKSGKININDEIIEIEGQSANELDFTEIMQMLRGPSGSKVNLTLAREHLPEKIPVTLTREAIPVTEDRVDVSYEAYGNGIIGKLTLHSFYRGDNGVSSEKDLKDAIAQLKKQGDLKGLVLDLRENSGGFLLQAVKVASLFITNGVVVISKYSNGEEKIYRDMDGKAIYDGPMVVLTSRATASAAEIVAQALQDYGIALIVGDEQTYGKGSIQSQTVTEGGQGTSYFKVTVGKYYTVSGKTPQIKGVQADIVAPTQFNQIKMGEGFLEYALKADTISDIYKDDLKDIDPSLKSWYIHYYLPRLQAQVSTWREMIPVLKKNSAYRISNNKNYQTFLKILKGEKPVKDDSDEEAGAGKSNFGADDLQMNEAVNVVKDMIYLHSRSLGKAPVSAIR